MAGFFSVKMAPGLRLSASPRGLRAHVGPRGARLHVGGGGTGVSTGAGPVTWYESVGGGRRSAGAARRPPSPATLAKAQRAQRAREVLDRLTGLHREEFPPAVAATADAPPVLPLDEVVRRTRRELTRGIGWLRLRERREARRRAVEDGRRRHAALVREAEQDRERRQRELDGRWDRLLRNDTETVLAVLTERFADNEAAATVVGATGSEVELAVLVPGPEVVPERMPGVTARGNVSLARMSQTERAEIYREVLAGYLLATVKEAFAAAPGVTEAAAVAVRDEGPDIYGADRVRPILAARFGRAALGGVRWPSVSAWEVVDQAGVDVRAELRGRPRWPEPLDLREEQELQELVTAIDWDDAAG